MLTNKTITLLISGSIAAYKTAELVRELKKQGARVRVAMSDAAKEFVTPLVLQTLSNERVHIDLFDLEDEREIGHIELADSSDIIVSAPASANILAKIAHGIADDLLSTVILAAKCPVIFFPAMNVNMWENSITQENVEKLREHGYTVVSPDSGALACGWTGSGRLPDLGSIIDEIASLLRPKPLQGVHVLVTAGPTHEPLDPVRFLSNRSSGKMGYAIARMAKYMGAEVTLISGPSHQEVPRGITFVPVTTAQEMKETVFSEASKKRSNTKLQIVYMAAAVSDHTPKVYSSSKLKLGKLDDYSIECKPSPDILALLGQSRIALETESEMRLVIVGFAAETGNVENLIKNARGKLEKKNVDLIVGNFAEESFGNNETRVWLVTRNGQQEEVSLSEKHFIAEKIINCSLQF